MNYYPHNIGDFGYILTQASICSETIAPRAEAFDVYGYILTQASICSETVSGSTVIAIVYQVTS